MTSAWLIAGLAFSPLHPFDEQRLDMVEPDGVRAAIMAPRSLSGRPVPVLIYLAPNGSSTEETLGAAPSDGQSWRFDIQHVAAQVRALRQRRETSELCLVVATAPGLSWPRWRANQASAPSEARRLLTQWLAALPVPAGEVTLAAHSGGGAFLWATLEAPSPLPSWLKRMAWFDANYSFDADRHGPTLQAWLQANRSRQIRVLAYDDRRVTLDGQPVVSETGGTYRATHRMASALGVLPQRSASGDWIVASDARRQIDLRIHVNPKNEILHTRLVGEMNGVMWLYQASAPLAEERRYRAYIAPPEVAQDVRGLPPRSPDAIQGRRWMDSIALMMGKEREAAILGQILSGNVPGFLRRWIPIRLDAAGKSVIVLVMPDVLSVGSDQDWVRTPMTPQSAQRIADLTDALLITDTISDAVYRQADLRLNPVPLTKLRDRSGTFLFHHDQVEAQRGNAPLGRLVAGIKKDVVLTNRLLDRPDRVAIYGWHRQGGKAIQPVYAGHVNWYVDYSHGIRLVSNRCWVDGEERSLRDLLQSTEFGPNLASDGPLKLTRYPTSATEIPNAVRLEVTTATLL